MKHFLAISILAALLMGCGGKPDVPPTPPQTPVVQQAPAQQPQQPAPIIVQAAPAAAQSNGPSFVEMAGAAAAGHMLANALTNNNQQARPAAAVQQAVAPQIIEHKTVINKTVIVQQAQEKPKALPAPASPISVSPSQPTPAAQPQQQPQKPTPAPTAVPQPVAAKSFAATQNTGYSNVKTTVSTSHASASASAGKK